MASLTINTQILHKPGLWGAAVPVTGALCQIIDIDAPGMGNDIIFSGTTESMGHLGGQTSEWRDTLPVWIPGHFAGGSWVSGHWQGHLWVPGHVEGATWVAGQWETKPDATDIMMLQIKIQRFGRTATLIYPYVGDTNPTPPVIFPFAPNEEVRLHLKILSASTAGIDDMISAMQILYSSVGISVIESSRQSLTISEFSTVSIDKCLGGTPTPEQTKLYTTHRKDVGPKEIAVYIVDALVPTMDGCANHPPFLPSCVVEQGASKWTIAHEVGHILGLRHVENRDRLMNNGDNFTNTPPDLVQDEVQTMYASGWTTQA